MFKRIEKRRRKREEEEELGLDDELKEVLGMHDTDSEESASDSDDSDSGDAEGSDNEGEAENIDQFDEESEEEEEEEEKEEEDQPTITVQEALRDPIYLISLDPTVKGCIVCPGKLLKGTQMVDLHRTSNAHERRTKQFAVLASKANPKSNAWELVAEQAAKTNENHAQTVEASSDLSKRAQKRKAQTARRKTRRDEQKAKAKAKKAGVATSKTKSALPVPEPPKKKQKVEPSKAPAPPSAEPPQSPNHKEIKSIAAIARSASERAKAARAKVPTADDMTKKHKPYKRSVQTTS